MSQQLALQLRDGIESAFIGITGMDEDYLESFEFSVGTTQFTGLQWPVIVVTLFCIGIPFLEKVMTRRESPPIRYLILFHNLFLSFSSALLAFYLILNLYLYHSEPFNYSFKWKLFCGLDYYDQKGRLTLIYYINYLLKYYELLDTIFLVLKHKPISFLHGYHHPATLVLTWGQLVDSTGVQWMIILLNLFVHTIMYFYYAMSVLKVKMPWKRCVTILQILQFIIGISACYTSWAAHNWWGRCFGTTRAALIGCFVLTSYLFLFVDFYQETYNKRKNRKNKKTYKKKKTNITIH
eukprot:69143_1